MPNRREVGSRMKWLNHLTGGVAFVGLAASWWWSMNASPTNAANLQRELTGNAEAALAAGGFDWASVQMDGQRAVLTGAAPTRDSMLAAADALLHSSGPGGVLLGGVTIVESAVDPAKPVSPFVWRAIRTADGQLRVDGHVPSQAVGRQLEEVAGQLAKGGPVTADMQIEAGAPGGNWQGVARLGLEALAQMDAGQARLSDTTLRVSGVAMDSAVRARLSADIANISAPYRGEPLIKGPSLWSAVHEGDRLVLSGRIATEAERVRVVEIATMYFAGEVDDQMDVTEGVSDDWLDGVEVSLPHFAHFRSGEMGFHPDETGLTIEGEAAGSTLQYLREDLARIGSRYPVNIVTDTLQADVAEIEGIDFGGDPVAACGAAFAAVLAGNPVTFEPGSARISRDSGRTLDKLMAVSQRCAPNLVFELGGHTDIAGDRAANLVLSEARARAVAVYMQDAGFDGTRLSAIGYGPDHPVQPNDTEEGRAANRRLEFKVLERSN